MYLLSKKKIFSANDIKRIYSEIGTACYTINNVRYNSYNIVVGLANGSNIRVIKGELNYENKKEEY